MIPPSFIHMYFTQFALFTLTDILAYILPYLAIFTIILLYITCNWKLHVYDWTTIENSYKYMNMRCVKVVLRSYVFSGDNSTFCHKSHIHRIHTLTYMYQGGNTFITR